MKKQSGFTLIELLLVLAIIGIISAIAIPALLSQRARARDKASIDNMVGRVGDMVGQYDKLREAGSTTANITTKLGSYLSKTAAGDKNPWDAAALAYNTAVTPQTAAASKVAFDAGMSGSILGQSKFYIQYPTSTLPGFVGGVVKVQNVINGSTTVRKSVAIE
jgi:prepilin-type N-terminal cleavage/methylation domain-containing protein